MTKEETDHQRGEGWILAHSPGRDSIEARTQAFQWPLLLLPVWPPLSLRQTNSLLIPYPMQAPRERQYKRKTGWRGQDRHPAWVSRFTQGPLLSLWDQASGTSCVITEVRRSLLGGEVGLALLGIVAGGADLFWAHLSRAGEKQREMAHWKELARGQPACLPPAEGQ